MQPDNPKPGTPAETWNTKLLTGSCFTLFLLCGFFIWRLNATKQNGVPSREWLTLDYCFIVVYTAFSISLCLKGRQWAVTARWRRVGVALIFLLPVTALFDVAENLIQGGIWVPRNHEVALDILRVLKFVGTGVAIVYFLAMHPSRSGIARAALGALILAVATVLTVRMFKGQVALYAPAGKSTERGEELEKRLKSNVLELMARHPAHVYGTYSTNLSASADWLFERFKTNGPAPADVTRRPFTLTTSRSVLTNASPAITTPENIVAERSGTEPTNGIIVIGAHYDTMPFSSNWTGTDRSAFEPAKNGTPGANDNASGVAALLEIEWALHGTKLKRTVRFVAFANEEPPFFQNTNGMGSYRYAAECRKLQENIVMMISLDAVAVYDPTNRTQTRRSYASGLGATLWGLPNKTDYVAFMSNWNVDSGSKAKEWAEAFAKHSRLAVRTSSLPFWSGEYFAWSDDWSFTRHGFPAFTVTDTAFYRSGRYHMETDTVANLSPADWRGYSEVVQGLIEMLKEMANR